MFYSLLLVMMFVQMTAQVLRVLVIALLFTVSTRLVFHCSKSLALFRFMPTAHRARGAVKQLSAESCTLNRGSAWSLSSPPASRRSESAAGAAGGAGRLLVSEATHDIWTNVVHTAISFGTSAMVFDATPHISRVEIDTPVHGADPLQCPQFELHAASAVARHPVRRKVSWKDRDSDDEANSDNENGARKWARGGETTWARSGETLIVYLKMDARWRDNLGVRRRDSLGLGSRAMGAAQDS